MGAVKVNADLFMYKVPNEETGQPPVARAAFYGEEIDIDAAQERRGRALLINRDYPYGNTSVRSVEPALVDVDHDAGQSAAEAARHARVRQLQAELAALDAAPVPTVVTGENPVTSMVVDDPRAQARIASGELAVLQDDDGGITPASPPPAPPAPAPPAPQDPAKVTGAAKKAPRSPER